MVNPIKIVQGAGGAAKGAGSFAKNLGNVQQGIGVAQQGVAVAQQAKAILPSFPGGGGSSGGSGGGGKKSRNTTTIIIVFFIIAIFAIVGFWFVSKGGLQATGGSQYIAQQQQQGIMQNVMVRQLMNFFQNPFGVRAESGSYEEQAEGTQQETTAPGQAFSISTTVTPGSVFYDQSALTIIINAKNEGSTRISELALEITSENPINPNTDRGCLVIPAGKDSSNPLLSEEDGKYKYTITDIAPFSAKQIVIKNGEINKECIKMSQGTTFEPTQPLEVFVNVRGSTYYPTSSRLTVERIKTDYGTLLMQNSLLMQQSKGAIYQTGTALSIDMDAGEQPILDSVKETALLMSWVNVGNGVMDKNRNPFLFIATPGSFGQCKMRGLGQNVFSAQSDKDAAGGFDFEAICNNMQVLKSKYKCILCDDVLKDTWCKDGNAVHDQIEKSAGSIKESFRWACSLIDQGYHVCATNGLTQEFGVMTCTLDFTDPANIITATRSTKYVTAVAIYPYIVESPYSSVSVVEPS